nr:hypothetical protein [Paracoccus sp. IB05]
MAAEAGQLQLNAFEPVIACTISRPIRHLTAGCETLRAHCITGITANHEVLARAVTQSIGIVTALNPCIGYENATDLAREAFASGRGVCDLAPERGLLPEALLVAILSPENLTRPTPPPGPR